MIDLTQDELQAVADFHRDEAEVYADCVRAGERNPNAMPPEELASYHSLLAHHSVRGRMVKELLAQEESDQTAYEEEGKVILRRPYWLDECIRILTAYMDEANEIVNGQLVDGMTAMACSLSIQLLEHNYAEGGDDE